MTRLKEQAVEILQELPDDKIIHVIEMLKGLYSLYHVSEDIDKESELARQVHYQNAKGIFKRYANPDLAKKEKDAWGEAVKDKYADYRC